MLLILSLMLKLAGVGFLCIAGLGVMRLSDPFQRMHAATKAGTLGAGLVILGSMIGHGATDATVMGLLTIIFLLLTVPVAGHLLGRASYVSGARLSLRGDDALQGVLERSSRPLDERMGWLPEDGFDQVPQSDGRPSAALLTELTATGPRKPVTTTFPALDTVRFVAIDGHVETVATRASAIASRHGAALSAHVIVDTAAIDSAAEPAIVRQQIRERAGEALHALRSGRAAIQADMALHYDEGDPERLLSCGETGRVLLCLPCEGWFHHQVEARRSLTSWEPDGLLRLPSVHRGPVLFAAPAMAETSQTIVVRDRGETNLAALLEWALVADLWEVSHIVHVGNRGVADLEEIEAIARRFGCTHEGRMVTTDDCAIPGDIANPRAVILGQTPRPRRTIWFGSPWRQRISPQMTGDVLVMELND